jgi:hypothetical protein
MDYSKFDTHVTFCKAKEETFPGITLVKHTDIKKVVSVLGNVMYQKVQEYSTNEHEVKRCTIRVPWNPLLEGCTHVEVKTFYSTDLFVIEIQQMPFHGEVEMLCTDASRDKGTLGKGF